MNNVDEQQLLLDKVDRLYGNFRTALVATLVNATVLVVVLWNVSSHNALVSWLVCVVGLAVVRSGLGWAYHRSSKSADELDKWVTKYTLGVLASGVAWGLVSLIETPADLPAYHVFIAFVLGGMVAGAVGIYSIMPRIFLAFSLPALIPISVHFFFAGGVMHAAMGGMVLLFLVLMTVTSFRVCTDIMSSMTLRLENVALLSQLTAANDGLRVEIEERKHGEEALRESESRYRTLFESASDGIFIMEGEVFTDCNAKVLEIFGRTREQIIGHSPFDFSPPTQPDGRQSREKQAELIEATRSCQINYFEWQLVKPNGERFNVEVSLNLLQLAEAPCIQAIVRDVTERKRTEQNLRKLSSAVEHAPAMVVITDSEGRIEYVNPAFTEVTGYTAEEAIGKNPKILKSGRTSPELYKDLWKTIMAGETWKGELLNHKKDSTEYWERSAIAPVLDDKEQITHFVAVKEDITERKRMKERLLEAQKLESLGTMAGGIAHMFNNLLGIIIGYAELLEEDPDLGTDQHSNAGEVLSAARRAAELSSKMLSYTGQDLFNKIPLDLHSEAVRWVEAFGESLPKNVSLDLGLIPNLPIIKADRAEMEKAVVALLTNAVEALGEEGGTIRFATDTISYKAEELGQLETIGGELEEGDYVYLDVSDNGCGMDREAMGTIFDPFFTTKFEGRGMGLPVALGIVRAHSGAIMVESDPALGTRFRILLPVAKEVGDGLS